MTDLNEIIANAREQANVLRLTGNAGQAEYVDQLVTQIADATEEVRKWISEADAHLRSGWSMRTLRRRFQEWLVTGHARQNARKEREYRLDIIPLKEQRRDQVRERARRRVGSQHRKAS